MATSDNAAFCLKLEAWPAPDQIIWMDNSRAGDPFDDPRPCDDWRPATWSKVTKGYGRWLAFLASQAWLDPAADPSSRITAARLHAYVRDMRERGNADATIIGRVGELAMAMTVLAPNVDHGWIRKPFGPTMYSLLPRRRRPLFVPSAGEMFAWGYTILEGAATKTTERERLVAFRDGLLVSLLAICARRLRAIAGLRVGHELVQTEKGYRLELPPELIKTKKYDLFDLPVQLTPHIDHYLHAVRPRLLQGAKDDAVWINERGKQCSPKLIQSRVFELSDHQFGVRFGPHRFRYSIATSGPHIDPENPAIGAEVLGISKEVLQQHYNRGNQAKAVRTFNACLEKRIAEAEKLLNPSGLPGKGHKQV